MTTSTEHPEILEQTSKKHTDLDERLKQVFVTSSHEVDQARILDPDKPLPKETKPPIFFELGFKEVPDEKIPRGKCSLRQALTFLGNHKIQPEVYTAEKIALDYKMNLEDVQNLLEYYKIFDIMLQAKDEKEKQHRILLNQDVKRQDFNKLMKLLQTKPDPDKHRKQ
jgi:NADH dehydrogenase [ubiquinone] 1 alpha subcomplex assembly factor 4